MRVGGTYKTEQNAKKAVKTTLRSETRGYHVDVKPVKKGFAVYANGPY